jgi:hypothetical protein
MSVEPDDILSWERFKTTLEGYRLGVLPFEGGRMAFGASLWEADKHYWMSVTKSSRAKAYARVIG